MRLTKDYKRVSETLISQQEEETEFNRAIVLRDSGKLDEACKVLTALIEKHPQFSPPYAIKAGILFDLKLYEDAEDCFREAVTLKPLSELASLGLFHSLWNQGRQDIALEEMERFFSVGGKSEDYQNILTEITEKTAD